MKSLKYFLTHNWFAKLFALLLATMLWATIASETLSEIGVDVPLQYRNIPPQLEVAGETTNTVQVRLRGSANLVRELTAQDVSMSVNLAGLEAGERVFQLTPQDIQVPFGVEVVRVNPSRIRLSLERTLSKVLPVTLQLVGKPAPGFEVRQVLIEPHAVEIHGPENQVRGVEAVSTAEVNIEGATADIRRVVDLGLLDSLVRFPHDSAVQVHIRIGEEMTEERLTLALRAVPGQVLVRPSTIEVTVKGPRSRITRLDPDELYFTVYTESLEAGEHDVQPHIVGLSEDIAVSSTEPDTVMVRIQNR